MDYMSYIRAIRSADLTYTQKITAIMIASHYDFTKGEPAFPSNKLLSKETGLGVSTVVKAKKVLVERGYLCSKMQWDNSCLYTPMLPDSNGMSLESSPSAPKEKLNTHINTHINTQVNTNINKNVSNETLILSTEVKAEESSAINNNMSFDDMFYKFERVTDEERNPRPAPAGSSYKSSGRGSNGTRRNDIDDAELAAFNQELAEIRASEW